jgi:hypothetical protein
MRGRLVNAQPAGRVWWTMNAQQLRDDQGTMEALDRILFAAALLPLGIGCTARPDEVAGATDALTAVTWTDAVGVDVAGNHLVKSSATPGWNAGAVSVETLTGDGSVELTTDETTTAKMAGLSAGDFDQSYQDIDFAFYLRADGVVAVREAGLARGTFGTYQAGDLFRIQVDGGVVTYWQNGALLYTSGAVPSFPLLVDTSLRTTGATISDVVLAAAPFWTDPVGAEVDGADLVKTAPDDLWNAGAASIASLAADGYAEFTTGENTTAKMAGLSSGNSGPGYADIDFAVYLKANGTIGVREAGLTRGSFGPYAAGDIFRISAIGGVVTYARNGAVFYTSGQAPSFPLLLDSSLRTPGATILDARLAAAPPVVVFDNSAGTFTWTPSTCCNTDDPPAFVRGAYLDVTLPADAQGGEPGLASIEFYKKYPEPNITKGGFYFRSWRNPADPTSSARLAAGDDVFLDGSDYDFWLTPPLVMRVGDRVGPGLRWIRCDPGSDETLIGAQAVHLQDPAPESAPTQVFFASGVLGVRFTAADGRHYGFVELVAQSSGDAMIYLPVRWGYNTVPEQALVIPP